MTSLLAALALILAFLWARTRKRLRESESAIAALRREATEREQKQRKAQKREIQHLIDAIPSPFFSIDNKGVLIRVNQEAREIFGDRDILNRSIPQVFLDASIVSLLGTVRDKPQPIRQTLRFPASSVFSAKSPDKESHWEIEVRPLSLQSNTQELQLLMRDVTASTHADMVRQDFVANASHELRTPLSIISGYLENLNEEGMLDHPEMARQMLGTMERHVTRINRIVDDMLAISKLESENDAPLKLAPFDLTDCVHDIIERLELMIQKQGALVEIAIPKIQLTGDQFYWTQILFNLIENALKQNPTTPVTVRIEAELLADQEVAIRVIDNGIGIPAGDLPFIFKRFYRVEKHHSQNQIKGTGLGLSIVKRAIEAHRGTITVASTPGVQTTFTITAPQKPYA